MFKKILEKLATMTGPGTAFGGDVEEALEATLECHSIDGLRFLPYGRNGMIRALYDLGLLVALPPPQDGEVGIDWRLAQKILDAVTEREVELLKRCKTCKTPLGQDGVRLRNTKAVTTFNDRNGKTVDVWEVWAFCPVCAEAIGPEWVK